MDKIEILRMKHGTKNKWDNIARKLRFIEKDIATCCGYCMAYKKASLTKKHPCCHCPLYKSRSCSTKAEDNSVFTQALNTIKKLEGLTKIIREDIKADIEGSIWEKGEIKSMEPNKDNATTLI